MGFDINYQERVVLSDGSTVFLRSVLFSDKDLLRRGFERLSPQSRYFRFFTTKKSLSDEEIKYFTEVDGVDHIAIAAVIVHHDQTEEGVGIARSIRIPDEPEVAEAAIAVIDEMQRKGLGTLLLTRLGAAAYERGVRWFRCEVLAANRPVIYLLQEISSEARFVPLGDGITRVEAPLLPYMHKKHAKRTVPMSGIYKILSNAASGAISVKQRNRLGKKIGGIPKESNIAI